MPQETTDHIGLAIKWFSDNWQLTTLLVGGLFWAGVWSVKKVFPTHRVMKDCEETMRKDLKDHEEKEIFRFREFKNENAIQHESINSRLDRIIEHLIKKNGV